MALLTVLDIVNAACALIGEEPVQSLTDDLGGGQSASGGDALRSDGVGELRSGSGGDLGDGDPEIQRGPHDDHLPSRGRSRDIQFAHGTGRPALGGGRLSDGLGPVGQEFAGLGAAGAAQ